MNDDLISESVRLDPGEAFSCLFKLKADIDPPSAIDYHINLSKQDNKHLEIE